MSWWWLLACTGTTTPSVPEQLTACSDPTCAVSWLDAHWGTPGALDQIASHPDEVVQLYVLQQLIETRPAELQPLCERFAEGSQPRSRCNQLHRRPHLWEEPAPGSAGGRACTDKLPALVPAEPLTDPWGAVVPLAAACSTTETPARCQLEAAIGHAEREDIPRAAASCAAIEDDRWRHECAFQVMEASWQRGRHGDPGTAATACLAAGPYLPCCLGHLAREVGLGAPAADEQAPRPWQTVLKHSEALRRALDRQDPALAERLSQQSLSVALTESYATARTPTGNPADALPEDAIPYLHAGVALALLEKEGQAGADRSAADWLARLDEVLAARGDRKREDRTRPRARKLPDHWDWSAPVPEDFVVVPLLDTSRRVRGPEPEADRLIALLEVGAALMLPLPALARDAVGHPSAEVRWTVARLASHHQVGGLRRQLRDDPDARVRRLAAEK